MADLLSESCLCIPEETVKAFLLPGKIMSYQRVKFIRVHNEIGRPPGGQTAVLPGDSPHQTRIKTKLLRNGNTEGILALVPGTEHMPDPACVQTDHFIQNICQ